MNKFKKMIKLRNLNVKTLLYILIVACPILDITSFLFRNAFKTNFSPSTVLRPLIPIIILLYIFIKDKNRLKIFIVGILYFIYAIIHLYIFNILKTDSSYSNIIHELQYIINYSFMILNLFIFVYTFKNEEVLKLKNSLLIAIIIYICSIYLSIFTGTSSHTYIEGIGYKGWIESGNSISAILILSLCVILQYVKDVKYKKIAILLIILIGIFLTMLIGTRVGLYGFILVIFSYTLIEIIMNFIINKRINKKAIIISVSSLALIIILVSVIGSSTLERRKHLKEIENNIKDVSIQQESHISGDLLKIKESIDNNTIQKKYMSEAAIKSIIELYNIANKNNIANNDMRMQQLIYNICLVKNQANHIFILFGNGYMANFRELVLEMEVPAILFNFGIIGFILYLIPFFLIVIYGVYVGIKNIKKIDTEYIMLLESCILTFALSFLSGYTFFNSSNMIVIVVINTILINKIKKLK